MQEKYMTEKEKKKARKKEIAQQMLRAQRSAMYQKICIEQTPGIVAEIDRRVAHYATRRAKLLADMEAAPARLAAAQREVKRLSGLCGQTASLDGKVEKAIKLKLQLLRLESEMKELELTSEQMDALKKVQSMQVDSQEM